MSEALAARTLNRATTAMRTSPVACLPEIVKLMRTLSGNSNEVSVADLAEVIEKDAVVLSKVIGVANTLGYNPNRIPVSSINQAIHVIGYERIRSLAMSLLLVEQTSRSQTVEEQSETAMLALTAGCIAQTVAEDREMPDPEKAFVCASLRNFGRIVMVTCMLEDYRQAKQLAREQPDDDAFRQVFGLTPLQLGYQLLKATDLPEEIIAVLRELSPAACEALDTGPGAQMLALADFSAQLASLSLAPQAAGDDFVRDVKLLAARYANTLPALASDIPAMIDSATGRLDSFSRSFRLKGLSGPSLTRLKQRRAAVSPPKETSEASRAPAQPAPIVVVPAEAAAPAPAAAPPAPAIPEVPAASAPPILPEVVPVATSPTTVADSYDWTAPIDNMTALLRVPGVTRETLFSAVIDAMQRGLGAPECLLFSAPPGSSSFRLTHGRGRLVGSLQSSASLTARERTVFGVCLSRNENILVHHAADPKIVPYLPGWLLEPPALGAFALLPLTDGKQAHGVLLAGWPESRAIKISPEQVRLIRSLLTMVCQGGTKIAA